MDIKTLRVKLGKSRSEMAELTGVSENSIFNWENGCAGQEIKLVPYVDKIKELADKHGIDTTELEMPEIWVG